MYFIWTWDTLLCFVFLFCCFSFFSFWWDNDRTTSETSSPGLEAEGQTQKLLGLKLYCISTKSFLIFIYFIYCFHLLFFIFHPLCLSNACSAYCWIVHYLSLFISLKLFCLFLCFVFSTCLFLFHFFFNFFAFHLFSPFHSKYQKCYYYKLENT
jgi:hypothetical protein